jgi:hypothetical protein
MNGELAELIALAAYGSVYIAEGASTPPELFPTASVFKYTNAVEFRRSVRRLGLLKTEIDIGKDCASWYSDLRDRGVVELRLVRFDGAARTSKFPGLPAHTLAGFSNGTPMGLTTRYRDESQELWTGTWTVTVPKHADQRIWSVRFDGAPFTGTSHQVPTPPAAAQRLDRALDGVSAFAAPHKLLREWKDVFLTARAMLVADAPVIRDHPDMLPPNGYSVAARRLVAAASVAWVFGGMGSWNDISVGNADSYRVVTMELYEAVLDAIVAGTNEVASKAPR